MLVDSSGVRSMRWVVGVRCCRQCRGLGRMFRRGSLIGSRHTGSRPSLFRRRRVAGEGLVDRDVVGMAVGDLPLAILPAEYVGDSQCVGLRVLGPQQAGKILSAPRGGSDFPRELSHSRLSA